MSEPSEEELQDEKAGRRTQRHEPVNSTVVLPPDHHTAEDYDDSDMYLENRREEEDENEEQQDTSGQSQHFFPSFTPIFPPSPPLGHSRPPLLFQEPAHSHRPALIRPQHNSFQPITFGTAKFLPSTAAAENTPTTNNLLGSGNFGVIRGGTFYSEDEQSELNEFGSGESHHVYSPFYHSNNGHGRPAFYSGNGGASNPRPQHHRGNDFFANFRDFAEINTPAKQSYSEFVVVYVNKNSTGPEDSEPKTTVLGGNKPKNIIEQLSLLDQEDKAHSEPKLLETAEDEDDQLAKKPSVSAGKLKLAQMKQDKINKENNRKASLSASSSQKELHEPLLALS